MIKFVKKDEPEKVVMVESDEGKLTILDEKLKKDDEECTQSKSTE